MSAHASFETQVLEEALSSPAVALMRLSLEIDKEVRKLLAVLGLLDRYEGVTPPEALQLLKKHMELPQELQDSVDQFWTVRNYVIHGQIVGEQFPIRGVDYGLRIVRLLRAIPRHSYVVTQSGVTLVTNPKEQNVLAGVWGVMLETVSPEGKSLGEHIYPSRRTYVPGTSVSWEWNKQHPGWGEAWYVDPSTQEIKHAWSESLEFIGRNIDEV